MIMLVMFSKHTHSVPLTEARAIFGEGGSKEWKVTQYLTHQGHLRSRIRRHIYNNMIQPTYLCYHDIYDLLSYLSL